MNYRLLHITVVLVLFTLRSEAQVNAYARVTGIAGTTLTLSTVDENFDSFEDGDQIFIYQVKDRSYSMVSSPTGTLTSKTTNAGKMEVLTILSHTETAGVPTSITVSAPLYNSYYTHNQARIQIVTFPRLGSGNYTTQADILAVPWNGEVGGIIAFQVSDTLSLAHDIDASESGFRGGAMSDSTTYTGCLTWTYSGNNYFGWKGESIMAPYYTSHTRARGQYANGGGGGNPQYGPGGGGSNWGAGGDGIGIFCINTGGRGGQDLAPWSQVVWPIQGSRLFLGGGGGGGAHRQATPTGVGGNGGGLIYVKADVLRTSPGNCAARFIRANGGDGGHVIGPPYGGGGGGGGGGSMFLEVRQWIVDSLVCPIICQANGGDGGCTVDTTGGTSVIYGGGGGGSQGMAGCSGGAGNGSSGAIAGTAPGSGGSGDASGGSGAGPANGGVAGFGGGGVGQLPIELIHFTAMAQDRSVELTWATASESDNERFIVHRSKNGSLWEFVCEQAGAFNSSQTIHYSDIDPTPLTGVSFYRLEQIDIDGKNSFSNAVAVEFKGEHAFQCTQDLVQGIFTISGLGLEGSAIEVLDLSGRLIRSTTATSDLQNLNVPAAANAHTLVRLLLTNGEVVYLRPHVKF